MVPCCNSYTEHAQVRIGVYPRCPACKTAKQGYRYCGTETAVKGCFNWPLNPQAGRQPSLEHDRQESQGTHPEVDEAENEPQSKKRRSDVRAKPSPAVNATDSLEVLPKAKDWNPLSEGSKGQGKSGKAGGQTERRSSARHEAADAADKACKRADEANWTEEQRAALQVSHHKS